jgi:hypothetical protein
MATTLDHGSRPIELVQVDEQQALEEADREPVRLLADASVGERDGPVRQLDPLREASLEVLDCSKNSQGYGQSQLVSQTLGSDLRHLGCRGCALLVSESHTTGGGPGPEPGLFTLGKG